MKPPMEEISEEVKQFYSNSNKNVTLDISVAVDYLSKCYDSNVHILNRAMMEKWIAPTFVPIAKLVSAEVAAQ